MKILQTTILIAFVTMLFSCSMTIEKRRYRPGYHIDVVNQHQTINNNPHQRRSNVVVINEQKFEYKNNSTMVVKREYRPYINVSRKKNVDHNNVKSTQVNQHLSTQTNKFKLPPVLKMKSVKPQPKKSTDLRGKKKAAWVLGGLSMFFALLAIIGFGILAGWTATMLSVAMPFLGAAILFAIIAIIVRYSRNNNSKDKVKIEKVKKTKSNTFIRTGYWGAIASLILSIIGLVLCFFPYPIDLIGLAICSIAAISALMFFLFGTRTIKQDESKKSRVTLILSVIAIVMAIIGILVMLLIF